MAIIRRVTRWEPDAHGRLAEAALELFGERGFEQTTVEDIAVRAGLTKRTFFRYFTDKREVLFSGGEQLRAVIVNALAAAPASASPLAALTLGLEAAADVIQAREAFSRRRQRAIASSVELQERELLKMAKIAADLAEGLRARGVEEPSASVLAEAAAGVFRVAFERWVEGDGDGDGARELRDHVREGFAALRAVAV